MKKLIRYYSKHGSAKVLAFHLKEEWDADIADIHEDFDDTGYDQIICICAVYAGMMNKQMIEYIHQLVVQTAVLCIVGIRVEDAEKVAKENLKEDVQKLSSIIGVGGVLNFPKLGFMEKKIIQMVNKKTHFISKIDSSKVYEMWDEEAINEFIKRIKE